MADKFDFQLNSNINLLVTIDKKYVEPLCVMLASYGETHKGISTNLFIAHSSLGEAELGRIKALADGYGIAVHSIVITEHWFENTPVLARLPEESFYRLMAFHYLPKDVERCLYIDPDTVIRQPLDKFFNMDMGDNYIAASSHTHPIINWGNNIRLGTQENKMYFNSGVMLMNLELIRRDFTLEKILKTLEENIQRLWLGDQDMTNILFCGKIKAIDEKLYNLDERAFKRSKKEFTLRDVESKTAIIHYNGRHKPWLKGYKGVLDRFYPEVKEKGPAPVGKWKSQLKAIHGIVRPNNRQKILILGILAAIAATVLCWFFFGRELVKIIGEPEQFRAWLDRFGPYDELVFILIRSVQTMIKIIPAEPLEIGSGYAWGAGLGMLYCLIGNFIGTLVILALTRRFGRAFVECFLPANNLQLISLFKNSDKTYALLFFFYLIPGSPKDGLTYLVGMMNVKVVPFLVLTFIARIPSVLSSTLCGSTLAEKQYLISGLIFLATLVLALIGGLFYKKYTDKKMHK
ncbi:MAG: VTT domain-containing protein [Clostridia bacterium]|nr:VTT domain-containing protein [Clostridia bacterium]